MKIPSTNVFVMAAAFLSILLLMVARHHPPSRRKIKKIWHGRVYWEGESNTTMLRSSVRVINTTVGTEITKKLDIIEKTALDKVSANKHRMTDARNVVFSVSDKLDIENTVQTQERLLYMLTHFTRIAEKYDIKYWLCAGTLIGAIRHHGFIPWDADIDISIPYDSYLKLQNAAEQELPSDLWLQDWQSDPLYKYGSRLPKIRDLNSDYTAWSANHKDWHNGIQLDLNIIRDNQKCFLKQCCNSIEEAFPLKRVPFEHITVLVPQKHTSILKKFYGNIDVPPVNKRIHHQGKASFKAPGWAKKKYPQLYNVQKSISSEIESKENYRREMQVMVSVLSRRSAFETRQVIRETWASGHNNVFFTVGVCCPIPPNDRKKWTCKRAKPTSVEEQSKWDMKCAKQDLKIAEEESKYKDIIRMPDIDVYRHLPQKVKFGYKWGLEHTTAKWFVKTDDDSVVRIDTLGSYLQKTYNSDEYVVVGRIANGWGVPRSGKWAENNYKPSKYPKFPLGSVGHVVSKGVATYIVDNSDKLFNYQGEDVSIGIWLNESPLKSEVKWVTSKHMANHGNCKDTGMWVMGHNIKPAKMRECFAHKDEINSSLKSTEKKIYAGVNLIGGLGNNLFMLASIQMIAHKSNAIPCYTGSNAAKDLIELDMEKCPSESYVKQYENGYAKYTPFELTKSSMVGTYLQSYKYFKSIPPLKIKQNMNSFAQKYLKTHSNKATNVGIHVRRGDHLKYGFLRFPSDQYFKNAMQYFTRKYGDVQFFVASNDIAWCQKQPFFKGTQIISEKHTAAQDMAILANCDHVIISLGTFGWWAGLFSGGEVVYNADEFDMGNPLNNGKKNTADPKDYYLPHWTPSNKLANDNSETKSLKCWGVPYIRHEDSEYWDYDVLDLGYNRGGDTTPSLCMGLKVVAIEASPGLYKKALEKHSKYIQSGKLTIENIGVVKKNDVGKHIPYYLNKRFDVWNSFYFNIGCRCQSEEVVNKKCCTQIDISTTSCYHIFQKYGVPKYMKVDIEGMDIDCLEDAIFSSPDKLPKYISFEERVAYEYDLYTENTLNNNDIHKGQKNSNFPNWEENLRNYLQKYVKLGYTEFKRVRQAPIQVFNKYTNGQTSGPWGENTKDDDTGFLWKPFEEIIKSGPCHNSDWCDIHMKLSTHLASAVPVLLPTKHTLPEVIIDNEYIQIRDNCEGSVQTSIPHGDFGPNEYIVFIEGPTLHAFIPKWSSGCIYSSQIHIPVSGNYQIKIYKTRTRFDAIDETKPPRWPILHYNVIYSEEYQFAKSNVDEKYVWMSESQDSNYLFDSQQVGNKRDPEVKTRIMLDNTIPFKYMRNYKMRVHAMPSLHDKSILFSGDSQMRTTMLDMLKEQKLVDETYTIPFHTNICVKKWCFQSNTMGSCIQNPQKYDYILWNFGHWPASGMHHSTFAQYTKMVDMAVKCASSFKNKLFWVETAPLPLRNDVWVKQKKDWRTFHRIEAFNRYANAAFANIGVTIIPQWKQLLPLTDKINEDAHFTVRGVYRYFFDFLIGHTSNRASPLSNYNVYWNGIGAGFPSMLFDKKAKPVTTNAIYSENDILMVDLQKLKTPPKGFNGKFVVLCGEQKCYDKIPPYVDLYLGPPVQKSKTPQIPFFYAQFGYWRARYKANVNKNSAIGEHFLRYTSSNCGHPRDKVFRQLTRFFKDLELPVADGACENNTPKRHGNWGQNVLPSKYRFELSMDKVISKGFVTEKIVNAFMSGAIPIYWGSKEVFELFNKDAFIYYDINNPQPSLDKILYLEQNRTAYKEMKSRTMFAVGALEKYFSFSDEIGNGLLKKKIQNIVFEKNTVAHILTTKPSSVRAIHSSNTLKNIGFDTVEFIQPNTIGQTNIERVWSNKNAFLTALQNFIATSSEDWIFLFEDDISARPGYTTEHIKEALKKEDLFAYLGVCNLKTQKKRLCGRCAHAMAISKKGAKEILDFNLKSTTITPTDRLPKDEPYFDVVVDTFCTEKGPFLVIGPNDTSGWHGIFFQDRQKFPTGISADLPYGILPTYKATKSKKALKVVSDEQISLESLAGASITEAKSIQKSATSNVRLENGVIVKTLKGFFGYNLIQREKCVLDRLKKFKWAPKLLSNTDSSMTMTYVGEKVNKENIPLDYDIQMNQILTDMESMGVKHNDMIYPCSAESYNKHEVMVLNGRLSIVDFGWATINDSVPCGVSTKKFVPNWNPCPDKTILQVLKKIAVKKIAVSKTRNTILSWLQDISSCTKVVAWKIDRDDFLSSINSNDDIDIFVESIEKAVSCLGPSGTRKGTHIGAPGITGLHMYDHVPSTNLPGIKMPLLDDIFSQSIPVESFPAIRTTSLEHACILRWLEYYKYHEKKRKHLIWTQKHCSQPFTKARIRWSDLGARPIGSTVNCVVEIPKGITSKYEIDTEFIDSPFKVSRVLEKPMVANYGFIPQTYVSPDAQWYGQNGDGDPLDCIVIGKPIKTGTMVPVTVLGVLEFYDSGEMDWKIITRTENSATPDIKMLRDWFNTYKIQKVASPTLKFDYGNEDIANSIIRQTHGYWARTGRNWEAHIFIDWQSALSRSSIEKQLPPTINIIDAWQRSGIVDENERFKTLQSFYGVPVRDERFKRAYCVYLLNDTAPLYMKRKTTKGKRIVNTGIFDTKKHFRTKGHRVHATDNIQETRDNMNVLKLSYPQKYKFETMEQVFKALNNEPGFSYVVLRNFDGLPTTVQVDEHFELQLLVSDYYVAKRILDAVSKTGDQYEDGKWRIQNKFKVGNDWVQTDLRSVGDNYFDKEWEKAILATRTIYNNVVNVPSKENHKYSLAYHALIQKSSISKTYTNILQEIFKSNELQDWKHKLAVWLNKKGYKYVQALDKTVIFNKKNTEQ